VNTPARAALAATLFHASLYHLIEAGPIAALSVLMWVFVPADRVPGGGP
jgi:hypothetical protein